MQQLKPDGKGKKMGRVEKAVTYAQIKKIFALARERGMDNDLLHEHLQMLTKRDSLSNLSRSEAVLLIDSLEGRPGAPKGQEKASSRQMSYIFGLMKAIGWVTETGKPDMERLDGFLQSDRAGFRLGSYKWLDRKKASDLIEALKQMQERMKMQAAGK